MPCREVRAGWTRDDDERAAVVERVRATLDSSGFSSGGVGWARDELRER